MNVALENAGLEGGAEGDGFVGVDAAVGVFAEDGLDLVLDDGRAGHAADENHLVNPVGGEAGVLEGLPAWAVGPVNQIRYQLLKPAAAEGAEHVLGAGGVGGNEGKVDFRFHDAGKLDLGLLCGFTQTLEGHAVLAEIDACFAAELVDEPVHNALVEVVAAEEGVAAGGLDLEYAVAHLQNGDVEGAAAEVVDGEGLVAAVLADAVGHRSGGGFVDDAKDFESRNLAGVLGGLSLGVVEVGGDGDDGLAYLLAQLGFRVLLDLLEDHGGNLRGRELLAAHLDGGVAVTRLDDFVGEGAGRPLRLRVVELAAHEPLDGEDGVLRVGDGLTLGHLADVAFAGAGVDGDDGRGDAIALGVFDDDGFAGLHHAGHGVCSTQVDAQDLCHFLFSCLVV